MRYTTGFLGLPFLDMHMSHIYVGKTHVPQTFSRLLTHHDCPMWKWPRAVRFQGKWWTMMEHVQVSGFWTPFVDAKLQKCQYFPEEATRSATLRLFSDLRFWEHDGTDTVVPVTEWPTPGTGRVQRNIPVFTTKRHPFFLRNKSIPDEISTTDWLGLGLCFLPIYGKIFGPRPHHSVVPSGVNMNVPTQFISVYIYLYMLAFLEVAQFQPFYWKRAEPFCKLPSCFSLSTLP